MPTHVTPIHVYLPLVIDHTVRLNDQHSYYGTGIGLALCKEIVDNHQGEIFCTIATWPGHCFSY